MSEFSEVLCHKWLNIAIERVKTKSIKQCKVEITLVLVWTGLQSVTFTLCVTLSSRNYFSEPLKRVPRSRLITGEILSLSEHYIHEETFRCSTWSERSMRSTFVCMSVTYWVRVFMNICIPALHKHPLCLNTEWLNVNDDRNNSCSLMNLAELDINHITGHTLFNMCARPAITKLLSHETHIDWQGDLMLFF